MTKAQPTDQELREAYNDCRSDHAFMRDGGMKDKARIEKIKGQALWRWIQQRKDAAKKGSKL